MRSRMVRKYKRLIVRIVAERSGSGFSPKVEGRYQQGVTASEVPSPELGSLARPQPDILRSCARRRV